MDKVPQMWPTRHTTLTRLKNELTSYSLAKRPLLGLNNPDAVNTLAMQMVASLRRLEYTHIIRQRQVAAERADPDSPLFDPERAAIFYAGNGDIDEAFWLLFLATHFGKHPVHGWKRVQDVYSGLGTGRWTWQRLISNPAAFRSWLLANRHRIGGAFGNHRKYESLDANSATGTAAIVESYINWVGCHGSHAVRTAELIRLGGNDPHRIFDQFYQSMNVKRFGRLGKFDFLALVGRLDLAPIAPGLAYLKNATGPLRGARLLFGGSISAPIAANDLENWLGDLDAHLNVGMQVMEDSLCNWQKSPFSFVHFKG